MLLLNILTLNLEIYNFYVTVQLILSYDVLEKSSYDSLLISIKSCNVSFSELTFLSG